MRRMLAMIQAALLWASYAVAQDNRTGLYAPSVFDLKLGAHATELPQDDYIEFACGTDGGPPSQPIADWTEYGRCARERSSGLSEVHFKYDDETEFWAKANSADIQIRVYEYTSAYGIPIIVSILFDEQGFVRGFRIVSDPRVPLELRQRGFALSNYLMARYGDDWSCTDLPRLEGEQPYDGTFQKRRCETFIQVEGLAARLVVEARLYRKPGQFAIDPRVNTATTGQFESTTRFELIVTSDIPDADQRLAALAARGPAPPTEKHLLTARARDCAGCDLRGVNLKRANLAGANLDGANLAGANLHSAILTGANLTGANLEGANLNRVDARRAKLQDAILSKGMMYDAHFDAADLGGANLTQGLAGRAQFIRANLAGARMLAMDLRNARLNDANFAAADLSYSWLQDSMLTRANLTGAKLIEAEMVAANLVEANLGGADLQAADQLRANLRGADLRAADLSYARLTFANLSEAKIAGTIWVDAELPAGFAP